MNKPTEAHAIVTKLRDQMNERFTEGTATITSAELDALSAALAVEAGADLPIELDGVADAIDYGKGFWRSCSGCHETNEGVPIGPFSGVLKCHLGGGCFECGGVGAIWDTTDYEEMGRFLSDEALTTSPASSGLAPYYCTDCETHYETLNDGRCACGSGRVVSSPASSGVEGEAVAELWVSKRDVRWVHENDHVRAIAAEPSKTDKCDFPLYAHPAVPPAGQWMTMDSAPKDLENVIVCTLDGIVGEAYHRPEEGWWWANTSPGDYYADRIIPDPVVWQPLPAPFLSAGAGGEERG